MSADTKKVIKAAKAGGAVLKKYFGQSLDVTQKSDVSDFRTKADVESEGKILASLQKDFPSYNIYAEESGHIKKNSEYTFVIDPLDGTNNFVLGIPNFAVSIGLMRGDTAILGVIYVPMLDQVYWAEKGKGAYTDGKKLAVSNEMDIRRATLSFICGYKMSDVIDGGVTAALIYSHAKRVLTNWCPTFDFCMMAAGRVESIVNEQSDLYDYIAGRLIATEAGAITTDLSGKAEKNDRNDRFVISNNKTIHAHVLATTKTVIHE